MMTFKGDEPIKFVQMMNALASTFNREVDEALLMGYEMALDDLPIEAVGIAVRRAIRECKFMPTGRELRDLAGAAPPEVKTDSRALVAYATACKAVQKHGAYASVDFDDPLANAVVRDMGGWERFCDWSPSEVQWRQRDFLSLYTARNQSGVSRELTQPLVGICERQNVTGGFENRLEDSPRRIECGLPAQRPGLVTGDVPLRIGNGAQKLIGENVRMKSADVKFLEPKDWPEENEAPRPELSEEERESLRQKLVIQLKGRAEQEAVFQADVVNSGP